MTLLTTARVTAPEIPKLLAPLPEEAKPKSNPRVAALTETPVSMNRWAVPAATLGSSGIATPLFASSRLAANWKRSGLFGSAMT